MSGFGNAKKQKFIDSIPTASLEAQNDSLTLKCKFNFAYFCVQDAGQRFDDWPSDRILKLLTKFQEYSREPLQHWRTFRAGKKSGHVLETYGAFPKSSDFQHPLHVPHEVEWGRFRVDFSVRLVGFTVPQRLHDAQHPKTGRRFDCNTFYIVFLDADHRFYKTEAK